MFGRYDVRRIPTIASAAHAHCMNRFVPQRPRSDAVSISLAHKRVATIGLTAALLIAAAPAMAGNGSPTLTPGKSNQVEQLGPKYLLSPNSARTHPITAATMAMLVNEFGPKYLLGYELKAART
jgi:hypothetical protein